MRIALLDPFSGISGDMTLGALVDVGLDPAWLEVLPGKLGLDGVSVRVQRVRRAGLACTKVDFDIPPQPHGRGIGEIRSLVAAAHVPQAVRERADRVFTLIAECEGATHGIPPERVHLHEVGAVDAILDVVGAVWGFQEVGVERIHCGPIALGDGTVHAAHGELPVPAPATLRILEGLPVRPGPEGSGELATPTGAALVRVLSEGPPPPSYVPRRSGFGAGTRDPRGRPNALRLVLADTAGEAIAEWLAALACDVDDMSGEQLAEVAETARRAGALDVVLMPTLMKKGRPGVRVEVLAPLALAEALQELLLEESTTLGVRRSLVERSALEREERKVEVLGHEVRVKVARTPGGRGRAKPEFDDVTRVASATGQSVRAIWRLADAEAERMIAGGVLPAAGIPASLHPSHGDAR